MTTYTTQPSATMKGLWDIVDVQGRIRRTCQSEQVAGHMTALEASDLTHLYRLLGYVNNPRHFIANGQSYWIGGLNDYPKGFGGQRWFIRFHSGRIAVTDSLWHQGEVPAEYRALLPDNAMLSQLNVVVQRCAQCRKPATIFFNGRCRTCSGGLL